MEVAFRTVEVDEIVQEKKKKKIKGLSKEEKYPAKILRIHSDSVRKRINVLEIRK